MDIVSEGLKEISEMAIFDLSWKPIRLNFKIYAFCDASENAHCAVMYMHLVSYDVKSL